jgi:hypothetical protein
MPVQTLPPCGIGGASVSGGPCTGTYTASQAGQDAFSQISNAPVTSALVAAGVIAAGVLFVIFMVRKVAGFFGSEAAPSGGEPGTMEWDDNFWAARGREANSSMPDAEFSDDGETLALGHDDDSELDTEDDSPLDEEDAERRGDGMTDAEYDAFEWAEEHRREHDGDV